ncbi:hypothetical protein DTO271G3_2843 [Paecilomyces variotii]|nr:hypothetical protein DTO271G3_2843 [Paecilomyces variotii]
MSGTQIERIFNVVFDDQLRACGFKKGNGPKWSTLNTQWHDLRAKASSIWSEVHLNTQFEARYERWGEILQAIKNTAHDLDIPIVEEQIHPGNDRFGYRVKEPRARQTAVQSSSTSHQSSSSRRGTQQWNGPRTEASSPVRASSNANNGEATPRGHRQGNNQQTQHRNDNEAHSTSEPRNETEQPEPCPSAPEMEPLCTAGGKICMFCFKEGTETFDTVPQPEPSSPLEMTIDQAALPARTPSATPSATPPATSEIPKVLYRYYNVDSQGWNSQKGFVAGLFMEGDRRIVPVTGYSSDEFDRMFQNHVRWHHVTTPFISTFSDLLAPVHRALRRKEGASLAVIDTKHIRQPVYSASHLIEKKGLQISDKYTGRAEYLIWGSIPEEAIVTTFKISTLQGIAQRHSDIARLLQLDGIERIKRCGKQLEEFLKKGPGRLNKECGSIVGRCLRIVKVPASLAIDLAILVAEAWMFPKEGSMLDYIAGIEVAYGQSLAGPTIYPLNDRVSAEVVLVSESSDSESDKEENDLIREEDTPDDDDDNVLSTPCPSPRSGRTRRELNVAVAEGDLSPFQLPTPKLSSPVMKFFDSSTGTWNPDQGQQNGLRVEVFNPTTRAWSPLAAQTGLSSSRHPSPGQSRESPIVVLDDDDDDDGEKKNYDVEDGQQTGYDADDSDADTVMADVVVEYPMQPPVMVDSAPGLRGLQRDQFAQERAHINNILGYH